jgi:hypothetical protein
VARSERLIKLGDSWFSAKSILVERFWWGVEVEYFCLEGG